MSYSYEQESVKRKFRSQNEINEKKNPKFQNNCKNKKKYLKIMGSKNPKKPENNDENVLFKCKYTHFNVSHNEQYSITLQYHSTMLNVTCSPSSSPRQPAWKDIH